MSTYEEAVKAAARRYRRTENAHEHARADLTAIVIEALRGGERPTDVTAWSSLTATYIRRLAREAGVPGAPPGQRPQPHA